MMFPILSPTDAEWYEAPDAIADAFLPGGGMSCRDQWARAMGHADNFESDGMGACASIYRLDTTDRRCLAWCDAADRQWSTMGPLGPVADGPWAYVRSDDRGFWSLQTGDEETVREWLAWWVAANVPTYCERCEAPLERETVMTADGYADQYPEGLCGDCIEDDYAAEHAPPARDGESACEVCGRDTTDHDGLGWRHASHGPRGGLGDELRTAERGE